MNVALFALMTLRELVRRRLVAAVGVLTLLILAFTAWGMQRLAGAVVDGAPISEPALRGTAAGIVLMLAFLFSFVVALAAALIGAPAMAETIATGEILAVAARPVRRAEIAFGRWLGTVIALGLYVAVAGGLELLVVRAFTGYVPPHPAAALAYLTVAGAVVATAAVALATRLPSLAAGIVAALCFGLAWIGGIIQSVGLALGNERLADAGTLVTLLFPSDAMWRGALFALQPAVFTAAAASTGPNGTAVNPFGATSAPSTALLAWCAGWIVVVLGAGIAAFWRRDL